MVFELRAESGNARGSLARVGEKLGINPETLRNWVEKAEVDGGQRPGTTSDDKKRIAELERENRELRRGDGLLPPSPRWWGPPHVLPRPLVPPPLVARSPAPPPRRGRI